MNVTDLDHYEDLREAYAAGQRAPERPFAEWLASTTHAPIEDLNLPVRLYNALYRHGCRTVADVQEMFAPRGKWPASVTHLPGIGIKLCNDGVAALQEWQRKADREVGVPE